MRIVLAALAGLLLSSAAPPPAFAAGASLSLSPARGDSSSEFTATFRTSTAKSGCRGGTVTFTWDALLTLATRALASDCTAVATGLVPPPGANRVGVHAVGARNVDPAGGQTSAQAIYAILRAAPSAAPTPSVAPAAPTPPPPCDTRVARAVGDASYLEIAGITGAVTDIQHLGAMAVKRVAPAAMLPPGIGSSALGEVSLTRLADRASPGLQQAAGERSQLPCAHLELGSSSQFVYAIYAFHQVLVTSARPAGGSPPEETVSIRYLSVQWEYQPRDRQGNPAPVVTGSGDFGQTPLAARQQAGAGSPLNVLWILLAGLLVVGVVATGLFLVRTGRWSI